MSGPRVHHVALRAADVVSVAAFYRDAFELTWLREQRDEGGLRSVWLGAGGTLLMVERREAGEPAPDPRSKECLIFAAGTGGLEGATARLVARGPLEGTTAFTVYARDPEGRKVGASVFEDGS